MRVLMNARIPLASGLTDAEVEQAESTHAFRFSDLHRRFLTRALPTGDGWPDWRSPSSALQRQVDGPIEGVVFDVLHNAFWSAPWGPRPQGADDAERAARWRMAGVPRMLPLYRHRCLAAAPCPPSSPVFSVHQTDVVYYGSGLADWALHEFSARRSDAAHNRAAVGGRAATRVEFWSDVAEGVFAGPVLP